MELILILESSQDLCHLCCCKVIFLELTHVIVVSSQANICVLYNVYLSQRNTYPRAVSSLRHKPVCRIGSLIAAKKRLRAIGIGSSDCQNRVLEKLEVSLQVI